MRFFTPIFFGKWGCCFWQENTKFFLVVSREMNYNHYIRTKHVLRTIWMKSRVNIGRRDFSVGEGENCGIYTAIA